MVFPKLFLWVLDVMRVADAHSCENLRVAALSFICQNFSQVSKEISFLQLELCEVCNRFNLIAYIR